MQQQTSTILYNHIVKEGYYKIGLSCDPVYKQAIPGQFVTLRISNRLEPLLRRPFSIHRLLTEGGVVTGLEILYRVVGHFTAQLSEKRVHERVDLLGPLGHGFSMPGALERPVLVAGGIGVAPLVFLSERLGESAIDLSNTPVFIGGKSFADILCEDVFSSQGMSVAVSTDDGSHGRKGVVTELLEEWMKQQSPDMMIYACGPHGMLHAVAQIAKRKGIRCEVSIETIMACGLGVCMGCAVETTDYEEGYRHICKDGPVFDASVLKF